MNDDGEIKKLELTLCLIILIVFLAAVFNMPVEITNASPIPNIQNVIQTPVEPPPNIAVNVLSRVVDRNGLANVSLCYSVNGSSWVSVMMVLIEGDNYNGSFLASIPGQAVSTHVSYYLYALDAFFYSSQSPVLNYTVAEDSKEPRFVGIWMVHPRLSPITPWDVVRIRSNITDNGSGVANATLFYGFSEPYNEAIRASFSKVSMSLTDGTKYDGAYEGEIQSQKNGTIVWYYIETCDIVGNKQTSDCSAYDVYFSNSSYFQVIVKIAEIDQEDLSARLDIFFFSRLPSQSEPEFVIVEAYNGRRNGTMADFDILRINSSTTERFYYQGTKSWKVNLLGTPNCFPYDSYTLELAFEVYWSEIHSLQIQKPFFSDYRLRFVWEDPITLNSGANYTSAHPEVYLNFQLTRNVDDRLPVILPILALFFMLGGTLSVDVEKHLRSRLTVYLTSFVFIIGFLYTLGPLVPLRFGFTTAELLAITLTLGTVALVVSSFISASFSQNSYRILISAVLDSVAVLFIFALLLRLFRVGYAQTPLLLSLPTADSISTFVGILYGLTIRICMNIEELKIQITRVLGLALRLVRAFARFLRLQRLLALS